MKSSIKSCWIIFMYFLVSVILTLAGCGGGGGDSGGTAGTATGGTGLTMAPPSWDVNGTWLIVETGGTSSCGLIGAENLASPALFSNSYSTGSNALIVTTANSAFTGTISGTHLSYNGQETRSECPMGYIYKMNLYLQGYPIYDSATGTKEWTCYYPGGSCSGTKTMSAAFITSDPVTYGAGGTTILSSTFPLPSTDPGVLTIMGKISSDDSILSSAAVGSGMKFMQTLVPVHAYYKFVVDSPAKIQIELSFDKDLDLDFYLFNEVSGQPSTLITPEPNHSINPENQTYDLSAGTYHVGIRAKYTAGKSVFYTLKIRDYNVYYSQNELEENDTLTSSSQTLVSGTPMKGSLNPYADAKTIYAWSTSETPTFLYDVYKLPDVFGTGGLATINFSYPSTVEGLRLFLLNQSSKLIQKQVLTGQVSIDAGAWAIGVGSSKLFEATVPYNLTYYTGSIAPANPIFASLTQALQNTLRLQWTSGSGGSTPSGYLVYKKLGAASANQGDYTATDVGLATSYDFGNDSSPLPLGANYTFIVQAYTGTDPNRLLSYIPWGGDLSSYTHGKTVADITPPDAPRGTIGLYMSGASTVQLSWAASNSSDVTGYRIYRQASSTMPTNWGSSIATSTTNLYADSTALSANTTYWYKITAFDGTNESTSGIINSLFTKYENEPNSNPRWLAIDGWCAPGCVKSFQSTDNPMASLTDFMQGFTSSLESEIEIRPQNTGTSDYSSQAPEYENIISNEPIYGSVSSGNPDYFRFTFPNPAGPDNTMRIEVQFMADVTGSNKVNVEWVQQWFGPWEVPDADHGFHVQEVSIRGFGLSNVSAYQSLSADWTLSVGQPCDPVSFTFSGLVNHSCYYKTNQVPAQWYPYSGDSTLNSNDTLNWTGSLKKVGNFIKISSTSGSAVPYRVKLTVPTN